MLTTIYTDASIRGNKVAYAAWIRSDKGLLQMADFCPKGVKDINLAEMYAIYAAINYSNKQWPETQCFLINTDSMNAIRKLSGNSVGLTGNYLIIREAVNKICVSSGWKARKQKRLILRHVRAHTGKTSIRYWLNQWCDTTCGKLTKLV